MAENNELKIKELIYTNYAAEVKKEVMESLDGIFSEMSADILQPLTEVLKEEGDVDSEHLFAKFRDLARVGVLENYDAMWDEVGIPQSLAALQCLREEAHDKSCEQWRPTGKTPQEQIRPLTVKALQKKCQYLDRQIAFQENFYNSSEDKVVEIHSGTSQIQENRKILRDLIKVHLGEFAENETQRDEFVQKADETCDAIRE